MPRDRHDDFGRWSDDIVNSLGGADPALAKEPKTRVLVADRWTAAGY